MTGALVPLVLATHNAHKVEELRQILGARLDGLDLLAYDGPEPVEDGDSFEANALIKARAASAHTGFAAIADDSGITVAALGGAPGIHSARYAGSRDDADNVRLLVTNLQGADDRSAEFVCAAALVLPDGRETGDCRARSLARGRVARTDWRRRLRLRSRVQSHRIQRLGGGTAPG